MHSAEITLLRSTLQRFATFNALPSAAVVTNPVDAHFVGFVTAIEAVAEIRGFNFADICILRTECIQADRAL
jgi:hypothetical protein